MTFPKLKSEIKEQFLKALRSGDYQQGNGKLYESASDAYCCLGVLCNVVGYDNLKTDGCSYLPEDVQNIVFESGHCNNPPLLTKEDYDELLIKGPQNMNKFSAAGTNDAGVSFEIIADLVERNW